MSDETVDKDLIDPQPMQEAAEEFRRQDFKYEAFISYRHLEPDATVAAKVQQMIETFRVSREFYVSGKRPVFRAFRDRDELSATDLSGSLDDALRNSKFLIVICSRDLPKSEWCVREVETFKQLNGADRIIPVLVEGEPYESFPPPLLGLKKEITLENGEKALTDHEILAAELRSPAVLDKSFPGYAQLRQSDPAKVSALAKETVGLLKTEKYRIMAAILGCSYGDLKQRDKERRTRTMLAISSIVAVALLIFGVFMFRAYQKENAARRAAVQSNSAMLLNTASDLSTAGDKIKSLLVAEEAMSVITPDMEHYDSLRIQHTQILNDAVYNPAASLFTKMDTQNNQTLFALNPDSTRLVTGFGNNQLAIFDAASGALLSKLDGHTGQVRMVDWSPDGKWLVSGGFDGQMIIWDAATQKPVHQISLGDRPEMASFSKDGTWLVGIGLHSDAYYVEIFKVGTWEPLAAPLKLRFGLRRINFSADGSQLLAGFEPRYDGKPSMFLYDLATGKILQSYPDLLTKDTEGKDMLLPYYGGRLSADGKTLYGYTSRFVVRLDKMTGEEIFRFDSDAYLDQSDDLNFTEAADGSRLYFAGGSFVTALDLTVNPPKILAKDLFVGGPAFYRYHEGTNTTAVITEHNKLNLLRDGVMVEPGLDLGTSRPEFFLFSKDGQRLYIASPSNKQIRVVDLAVRNINANIPGQIVSVAPDNSVVLFYDGEGFFLWDNVRNERVEVPVKPGESHYSPRFTPAYNIRIAPQGKIIAEYGEMVELDKDGNRVGTIQYVILLTDPVTAEVRQVNMPEKLQYLAFSPDGATLAVIDGNETQVIIDVASGTIRKTIRDNPITPFPANVSYSADGKSLIMTTIDGFSLLLDGENLKEIARLPGQILYANTVNGAVEARGIFNNAAFTWTEAAGAHYTPLDDAVDAVASNVAFDNYVYHPQSNQLLLIHNNDPDTREEAKPTAFLVDFATGQLLKTFQPAILEYGAKGFISTDGTFVGLDEYYFSQATDPNAEGLDMKFAQYLGTSLYKLFDYSTLVGEGQKLESGRTLTEEEQIQLGIR